MSQQEATVKRIPPAIRQQANEIVERFNQDVLKSGGNSRYIARFKGLYLCLDRQDWDNRKPAPICRLEWTGDMSAWKFAIYSYSKNNYNPHEWMFPGSARVDGTIEGAMYAGLEAYEP
jgi:hypothetical protein